MAIRFYLVPKAGTGIFGDPFTPAYVAALAGVTWRAMDYGREPIFLVLADVTPAQHAAITGNADVVSPPADLSTLVGANLATVQTALEARNIPGSWIDAATSYRQVLQYCARLFRFVQRIDGLFHTFLFETGLTLDTTIGALTAAQRQRLADAADSFGIDRSGVTSATTLRQALRLLALQLDTWSAV